MFKNKPVTLVIASGLLVVLIVVTLVFQLAGGAFYGGRLNGARGNFQPGQMPNSGTLPNGVNPPADGQFPPGNGNDFQPGAGTNGSFSGPQPNFGGSSTTMKLMQLLRGVQIGAAILIAALGVLSVVGIMLSKAWGRKWAIVTGILSLAALIPSFFQMRFGSNIIVTLVKLALAVAVLVLFFLPKSKQVIAQA